MKVVEELQVCEPCAFVIAYGEYDDGTNAAERSAEALERRYPNGEALHLSVVGEPEANWSLGAECDLRCGSEGAGIDLRKVVRLG